MVFFPSYRFMEEVCGYFVEITDEVDILIQSQNMSEKEKEDFLKEFEKERSTVQKENAEETAVKE